MFFVFLSSFNEKQDVSDLLKNFYLSIDNVCLSLSLWKANEIRFNHPLTCFIAYAKVLTKRWKTGEGK